MPGVHPKPLAGLICSGMLHLGLTPQTVLSRTKRGSLPSACTTFSLLIAMPLGQCCRASSIDMSVRTIQPLAISLSRRAGTVSGSASAAFQLPMRSSNSAGIADDSFGGRCMLLGNSERASVGTPSASRGSSLISGSLAVDANACSSDNLYGWPASGSNVHSLECYACGLYGFRF